MKDQKKNVLIIIPAYNEAGNISGFLEKLEQSSLMEQADILVMNDASTDQTREIVESRHHTVVTHVFNLGYGTGLQVGYKYAVKHGYEYVIQMDADGQHDACNAQIIYENLTSGSRPDIVLGSRFLPGSVAYKTTLMKKIAYNLFRFLIRLGTGRKIMDPTTGLQGLSRRAFSYYAQYNHFDDKYPDANMIMQMLLLGFRVEEIPAVMHIRTEGVSMHSGLKPVIYMFRMMFSIIAVWMRIRLYHVDERVTDEDTV